jgi:dipeptidase
LKQKKQNMKKRLSTLFIFSALVLWQPTAHACTNFLVTKGASKTGATYITYSADSHQLYGELYYRPAAVFAPGTWADIREWDTGKPLGKIKQVAQTYSVIGNMNEYQVTIGETTYTGREELADSTGIMDYGSLIYTALQRSKTAREAIKVMTELVAEYGYYSTGESFSIGDPNEVWIMEMIGKGAPSRVKDKNGVEKTVYSKGAVWVAIRIPDGYISGHANQARITTFPLENGKTSISSKNIKNIFNPEVSCVYAQDVISFAKEKGFYKDAKIPFSFADAYAPVDFGGLRACEARVWAGFRKVCKDADKFFPYINGEDMVNRLPLYMKPDRMLTLDDVKGMMRDHFSGTQYDMTKDVGAGPYKCPYRWRPMSFKVDGKDYVHERAISTQQTGFSFVAEMRGWLPNHIGGINWFGLDDTYLTVYTPMYCGITAVPETFKVGNGSMLKFSWNSAFWVFNWVSNWTYSRWSDISVEVLKLQKELEDGFVPMVKNIDAKAAELYKTNPKAADELLTNFSKNTGDKVTARWRELGEYLLVKYMDGNVKPEKNGEFIDNGYGQPASPGHPAYPEDWYKRIVGEHGDVLLVRPLPGAQK